MIHNLKYIVKTSMPGSNTRKIKGNQQKIAKTADPPSPENHAANKLMLAQENQMEAMQANIIAELRKVQDDAKKELIDKIEALKTEVSGFRGEMSKRMDDIAEDLKGITQRVDEAEQRVVDIEEFNANTNDTLQHTLHLQLDLQARVTDLEARSRRNNIRVHGIPEEAEGTNMKQFMENFLKSELTLDNTPPLHIQHCHRSLGSRPPPSANPRSIVMCFLEYTIKEKVLQAAWGKKVIQFNGRRIYFDHDYPTDILSKRKAYNPIRKILKDKGHRFQTLYPAKLRVFYDGVPTTYNTVEDAMNDLKRRGIVRADTDDFAPATSTDRSRNAAWETSRGARWSREEHTKYIKERLRGYKRPNNAN